MTIPSCAFVVARQSRLASRSSASSSIGPDLRIAPAVRPCQPRTTVSRAAGPSGPSSRRLVRVSKDRPFTVSGAEESTPTCTSPCLLRRPVANRSLVPPSWFLTTLAAYSSSTLSGYCTGVPVMGFVAFRAARRRCPRHEVLPFEASLLTRSRLTSGWRTILAPGRRHPPGFPVGSPPALPPRPCCLDLEALLHV
jgi:hypothetical protein